MFVRVCGWEGGGANRPHHQFFKSSRFSAYRRSLKNVIFSLNTLDIFWPNMVVLCELVHILISYIKMSFAKMLTSAKYDVILENFHFKISLTYCQVSSFYHKENTNYQVGQIALRTTAFKKKSTAIRVNFLFLLFYNRYQLKYTKVHNGNK